MYGLMWSMKGVPIKVLPDLELEGFTKITHGSNIAILSWKKHKNELVNIYLLMTNDKVLLLRIKKFLLLYNAIIVHPIISLDKMFTLKYFELRKNS